MQDNKVYKRALSDALRKLMREKPFSSISTTEICKLAGISRRSFYHHFPDKYELLNWTYYDAFHTIPKEGYRTWDYFPSICRHLYEDRAFYSNAFAVSGQNSFLTYCHERLHPYILEDFKGVFASEKTTLYFADYLLDGIFCRIRTWLNGEPDMLPDEFAAYIQESVAAFAKRLYQVSVPRQETVADSSSGT